jgi:hypothetical protein
VQGAGVGGVAVSSCVAEMSTRGVLIFGDSSLVKL